MVSTNQWEVVSKPKKGTKVTSATGKKNDKSKQEKSDTFLVNAPKLEELVGVGSGETRFSALDPEAKLKAKEAEKAKSSSAAKAQAAAEAKKKSDKKVVEKKPEGPKNFDEALKQLSLSEITQVLDTVRARFSNSPILWLKDLVSYLNLNLNFPTDPTFAEKSPEYPASDLPTDVRLYLQKLLTDLEDGKSDDVLGVFCEQSALAVIQDAGKGLPVNGYKVLLQLLILQKPDLSNRSVDFVFETAQAYVNRPPIYLSVCWLLGQAARRSPKCGLNVWFKLMLPYLGSKHYGRFAMTFITNLLNQHKDLKSATNVFEPKYFLRILDLVFPVSNGLSLPVHIHKEILALYPKLKAIFITGHPEKVLHTVFVELLERVEQNSDDSRQKEILSLLVQGLEKDPSTHSAWNQCFPSHIPASTVLLGKLVSEKVSLPALRPTLIELLGAAHRSVNHGKVSEQAKQSVSHIQFLLSNMSVRRGRSWTLLNTLLLCALAGLAWYDTQVHGNGRFCDGKLGRAVDKYGGALRSSEAYLFVEKYTSDLPKWCESSYKRVHEQVAPFVLATWEQVQPAWAAASECIKSYATILGQKIEEYAPGLQDTVGDRLSTFKEQTINYSVQAWQVAAQQVEITKDTIADSLAKVDWVKYSNDVKVMSASALDQIYHLYHKILHSVGLCAGSH